jgi:hypothetical protein
LVMTAGVADVCGKEEESECAQREKDGDHGAGGDDAAADAGKHCAEWAGESDGPEDPFRDRTRAKAHEIAGPACQIARSDETQGENDDTEKRLQEIPEHVARHMG